MASPFANFLAKAQMDPGWFDGLGTGPQMLGGQIFPGHPAAQEFEWMEAGPSGTALMGASIPSLLAAFQMKGYPITLPTGKKAFQVDWLSTKPALEEGSKEWNMAKTYGKGFDFLMGIKNILNQAKQNNAEYITFTPNLISETMTKLVEKLKVPTISSKVVRDLEKAGIDANYALPVATLEKWLGSNRAELRELIMNPKPRKITENTDVF